AAIGVPGAGLVIEIPAAAALRAAPRALERRKSGQIDEGVGYPSRLGEKPDRVKLLEPRGSLSRPFTRSITSGFAVEPMCAWSGKSEGVGPDSPPTWLVAGTMRPERSWLKQSATADAPQAFT